MDPLQSALIGALFGGLFGAIVGGVVSLEVQRREQKARLVEQSQAENHAELMAREARRQERRERVYESATVYIYRMSDYVRRTVPDFEPSPVPPGPLDEDDLRRLNAVSILHGSAEVKTITDEFTAKLRAFEGQALAFSMDTKKRYDESDEDFERRKFEQRLSVRAARKEFDEAVDLLVERMAAELRQE